MQQPPSPESDLSRRVLQGEVRAGARLMRLLDDQRPGAVEVLRQIYPQTGRATIVGITGNPGSGKSTLVDQLIAHYRGQGRRVGVVCVDPSSAFSGGAILGDRIRMSAHANDPGVFIRSLATRGAMGGLSRSTHDVVHVLDAMGYDLVLIETVGVGQDEIDIVRLAHTSVVVLVPGLGDDIQAIKAGILEIADIFVINKADRPGVERAVADLRHLQSLAPERPPWLPPILTTVAAHGQGIAELASALSEHRTWLESHGELAGRARQRESHILDTVLRDRLWQLAVTHLEEGGRRVAWLDRLLRRDADPYTAADAIIAEIRGVP